ncbi:MAG: dihydroorotase [Saprospiraceae bacterium]|nr:dihydroorotase [Lewinella sp.]
MKRLIRNAKIIDPTSPHHGKAIDLFIRDGVIRKLGTHLSEEADDDFDAKGACISPGWLDIGTHTGDPGLEHREDLAHVAAAAAAGGYTGLAPFPNTRPSVHSKSEVRYILQQTQDALVEFLPIGAVSQDCAGKEITEMLDMRAAGAVAFSDGKQPVEHSGLLLRALLYAKTFDGVILNHPHDMHIIPDGQMHEGTISTQLGLKGIPSLSETLMVQRDLDLLTYSESRLHLYNISSAGSVELVRAAKERGLAVTCSVPVINLLLTDEDLQEFDPNLKVLPPLRTQTDREALIAGLQDGIIDLITSNHTPLEIEAKQLEFPYAKFGAIGLETAFAVARTALQDALSLEQLVEKLAVRPRQILGIEVPRIKEDQKANLTIFDPDLRWNPSRTDFRSKSKNTPFIGRDLQGKALVVIRGNQSKILSDW